MAARQSAPKLELDPAVLRGSPTRRKALDRAGRILARAIGGVSEERLAAALKAPNDAGFVMEMLASEAAFREPDRSGELDAARQRGRVAAAEILARPDMLSSDDIASRLGMTRQGVDKRRRKGELLALQGERRGYVYAGWQIGENGRVVPGLNEVLAVLPGGPWTQYRFFVTRHGSLGDRTAADALRSGDLEAVLAAAEDFGEQGGA